MIDFVNTNFISFNLVSVYGGKYPGRTLFHLILITYWQWFRIKGICEFFIKGTENAVFRIEIQISQGLISFIKNTAYFAGDSCSPLFNRFHAGAQQFSSLYRKNMS